MGTHAHGNIVLIAPESSQCSSRPANSRCQNLQFLTYTKYEKKKKRLCPKLRLLACGDPENIVRGGLILITFFFSYFYNVFFCV